MMNRTIKIISGVLFLSSLLLGHASAQTTISLFVSQDAYIDGLNPDENYGKDGGLAHSRSDIGGKKVYMLFDFSGPEWDQARAQAIGVESITFFSNSGNTRRNDLYMIRPVDGLDTWTEDGITWNNAPGNNVEGTNRGFAPFEGESIYPMGSNVSAFGWRTVVFDETQSALLLSALLNEDNKVTIGSRNNATQAGQFWFFGRDYEGSSRGFDFELGDAAAYLTVTVPEPSTYALIFGGLFLLLAVVRRRKGVRSDSVS